MQRNWRARPLKQDPKQGPKQHGRLFGQAGALIGAMLLAAGAVVPLGLPAAAHAQDATQGHPVPVGAQEALPAGTQSVPLETQDLVEAELSPQLVLPQTALWQFDFRAPYGPGGEVVCGRVNYQSAMRKYLGPQRFYAIIKGGVVKHAQLQDPPYVDPTGAEAERFSLLCDRK